MVCYLSALYVWFLAVFPQCVEIVEFEAECHVPVKQCAEPLRYSTAHHIHRRR